MLYELRGIGAPSGVSAESVASELQRIHETRGLTPGAVVDEARPITAVLHGAFEWDDSEAAQKYREVQARQVIRAVVLVPQPERHETAPVVRAFVSLRDPVQERARIYRPTLDAMADPTTADEVKRRLRHELLALRARYLDLLSLEETLQAVQEVMSA